MLGAVVFCVWEDIVAAKEKMILVFICSLHEVAKNKAAGLKSPIEEAKQYQGSSIEESKSEGVETMESFPNEEHPAEEREAKQKILEEIVQKPAKEANEKVKQEIIQKPAKEENKKVLEEIKHPAGGKQFVQKELQKESVIGDDSD